MGWFALSKGHGKTGKHVVTGLLLVVTVWLWWPAFCTAGTVSLSWDANSDADYYIVYWVRTDTAPIDPAPETLSVSGHITGTSFVTVDLEAGQYFFAVKAFNSCGNSSDYSDWVTTTVSDGSVPVVDDDSEPEEELPPVADEPEPEVPPVAVEPEPETPPVADEPVPEVPPVAVEPEPVTPPVADESEDDSSSYIIVTESPGPKSADGFMPVAEGPLVSQADDAPTIQVLDSFFAHLYWLKSGWSEYNTRNGEARIARGDIDGDGHDEIIVGFGPVSGALSTPGGYFQVLDDNYTHLAWGRVEWADYNEINGETLPACGDIDGDGKDEIVIGLGIHGRGYIEAFSFNHGVLSHHSWLSIQWPDYNDMDGSVRPVCADINGDGRDEIIAGLGSEGADAHIPGGRFEILGRQADGWAHLMWGTVPWSEYTEINGETWPAPGDLDGDGAMELAVGLGFGGDGRLAIFEFENDGPALSHWARIEWAEYNDLSGETRPVCGDMDLDGKDDIIIGWNTLAGDSENANYFKVLSYNLSKGWVTSMDSKSIGADIDSVPVKGAVSRDETITVGMVGTLEPVQVNPPRVSPDATAIVGADAGGGGCFIELTRPW